MEQLKQKAIEQNIKLLAALKCSYKIVTADGEIFIHDPHNVINPVVGFKRRRGGLRNPNIPLGEPTKHVLTFIKDLQIGDAVVIPYNGIHPRTIDSVTCNNMIKMFGEKSYMAERGKDSMTVLRVK